MSLEAERGEVEAILHKRAIDPAGTVRGGPTLRGWATRKQPVALRLGRRRGLGLERA